MRLSPRLRPLCAARQPARGPTSAGQQGIAPASHIVDGLTGRIGLQVSGLRFRSLLTLNGNRDIRVAVPVVTRIVQAIYDSSHYAGDDSGYVRRVPGLRVVLCWRR